MAYRNEYNRRPARVDYSLRKGWVEALRSNKYKQGCGCLHQNDCFCVMGVLVDLFVQKNPKVFKLLIDEQGRTLYSTSTEEKEYLMLPQVVRETAGVNSPDGQISEGFREHSVLANDPDMELSLAVLNDRGVTFKELADIIEDPRNHVFKRN